MDLSSPALSATRGRLLARFGAPVEAWWERLPDLLAEVEKRWGVVLGDPVGRGNTSLVIRCECGDGRAAVLKLTPEPGLGTAEAAALRRWESSDRVPVVFDHDAPSGALLLEAIPDETPLADRTPSVELDRIAALIDRLHRSGVTDLTDGVVSLTARVDFIFDYWSEAAGRVVPGEDIRRGHEHARALAGDGGRRVLLHGDLHPGNVLDGGGERGLVAIDPRPCVGDAAFDAVDWVFWATDDPGVWEPRSHALAGALGLERERLWSWCAALAATLAAARAARGADAEQVHPLLALARSEAG